MSPNRLLLIMSLVVGFAQTTFCQEPAACADFAALVKATYNFKPSRLSDSERNSKSVAMDRFWDAVKAKQKELLPCLRTALASPDADPWFRFDGSNLLVSLDPSPESKAIQIRNCTTVDLDDVDLQIWVSILAARGSEGFDVSEPGKRWLVYPKAKYYLPEHGVYEVRSQQGALFIFGSMDESQATPALLKIISQRDHPGRETALLLLMSQATPEALRALKQIDTRGFSNSTTTSLKALLNSPNLMKPRPRPKQSREEFLKAFEELLKGDPAWFLKMTQEVEDGEKDVIAVMKPEDIPLIRKVRRRIIASSNQHAIEYYKSFTAILMALTWRPELVK